MEDGRAALVTGRAEGLGKDIGADGVMKFIKMQVLRKREVEAELEARKSEEHR